MRVVVTAAGGIRRVPELALLIPSAVEVERVLFRVRVGVVRVQLLEDGLDCLSAASLCYFCVLMSMAAVEVTGQRGTGLRHCHSRRGEPEKGDELQETQEDKAGPGEDARCFFPEWLWS